MGIRTRPSHVIKLQSEHRCKVVASESQDQGKTTPASTKRKRRLELRRGSFSRAIGAATHSGFRCYVHCFDSQSPCLAPGRHLSKKLIGIYMHLHTNGDWLLSKTRLKDGPVQRSKSAPQRLAETSDDRVMATEIRVWGLSWTCH